MTSEDPRPTEAGANLILVPPSAKSAEELLKTFGFARVDDGLVLPPRAWLIDGLWQERGVGFIIGPPKVGKSWMSLDLAICIAAGIPFLDRDVGHTGRVLYFLGEDDLSDTLVRVDLLLAGHGLTRASLAGRLHLSELPPTLDDASTRVSVVQLIQAVRPTLVVIDPLARFLSDAEENSATEMRPVLNWLRQDVSRGCETGIAVVHHTDKGGRSARGTGDFRALYEVRLRMGERNSKHAVPVDVEMRGAKEPEPFTVTLVETDKGGMRLAYSGAAGADQDLVRRARALLLKSGADGISTEAARQALKIRWDSGKVALEAAGGSYVGSRKRWVLDECSPSSLGHPEASSVHSSTPRKREQVEAHPDTREAPEGRVISEHDTQLLESPHVPEDSGSLTSQPFPSQGGLIETPGEGEAEGGTESANGLVPS